MASSLDDTNIRKLTLAKVVTPHKFFTNKSFFDKCIELKANKPDKTRKNIERSWIVYKKFIDTGRFLWCTYYNNPALGAMISVSYFATKENFDTCKK